MSLMNPPIEDYWDSNCTASASYGTNGIKTSRSYSLGSNCLCGYCISYASHDVFVRSSFTRSIADFLMVVYSSGAGVVPIGSHRHRRQVFPWLLCMLMIFLSLRGFTNMIYLYLFYLSRCILMSVLCACTPSCEGYRGVKIRKIIIGGFQLSSLLTRTVLTPYVLTAPS